MFVGFLRLHHRCQGSNCSLLGSMTFTLHGRTIPLHSVLVHPGSQHMAIRCVAPEHRQPGNRPFDTQNHVSSVVCPSRTACFRLHWTVGEFEFLCWSSSERGPETGPHQRGVLGNEPAWQRARAETRFLPLAIARDTFFQHVRLPVATFAVFGRRHRDGCPATRKHTGRRAAKLASARARRGEHAGGELRLRGPVVLDRAPAVSGVPRLPRLKRRCNFAPLRS